MTQSRENGRWNSHKGFYELIVVIQHPQHPLRFRRSPDSAVPVSVGRHVQLQERRVRGHRSAQHGELHGVGVGPHRNEFPEL